jgi:hypothetical protein
MGNGSSGRPCSISKRIRRRSKPVSVSDDHEHLYKQMEANKMKPAQITVNLREFKGQRFLDVTAYQPVSAPSAAAGK